MTDSSPAPISPVVRWLAVALVVCTVVLLALGGLTTSRRAGMDDPAWPTEPWYLIVNGSKIDLETRTGFLLEHSHRAAGWVVGGLAAALAFAAWLSGPDKKSRLPAMVAVFLLLAVYGWFHGQMMAADKMRQATGDFTWPWPSIVGSAVLAVTTVAVAVWQLRRDDPAKWVRFTATLVLLGVMIQGLLGGLRVFLNSQIGIKDTIGVEFSQLHGLFAQVVFAGMVLLPTLAGPRRAVKEVGEPERSKLKWLSVGLVAAVFVQLIWAVWVRHNPSTLSQRLHILTAFVVVGLIIALAMRVMLLPGARKPLGSAAWHLIGMVVVQLLLGVEAWMLKFAAAGPEAMIPPMDRAVTTGSVLIRTGHQLVGAALLASAVVIAFRVLRPALVPLSPGGRGEPSQRPPTMAVMSTVAPPIAAEDVALVSLKTRLADYVELTKPKIAAMALVTVGVGFLLGATPGLAMVQPLLHTLVGAAVVAAGGSALNHWLERRADARMRRTANRPLVTGRLHHLEALVFGLTLSLLGVAYLWFALPSPAAAIAAAATAILYVGVYTPLKKHTSWNTVVGAIPGALPPVIGWCGATGSMDLPGWALFAILFVWQLPHFYSIAFMHRDDYARGGMKMLPNVDHADGRITGWATFATALLLVPVTVLPGLLFDGAWRWVYLVGSLPVAVWFLARCLKFARTRTTPIARSVLRGSLVYLLAVMALFVAAGVLPRYF